MKIWCRDSDTVFQEGLKIAGGNDLDYTTKRA